MWVRPQDYNAAANVEMVVTLPSDNFDAYFIKLRPKPVSYTHLDVYKRQELMEHIVTDPEGGVNPLPEYTDNSVYLDLREPSENPDEAPHPIQIIEFRLDFDSFKGKYELEKPDEEEEGE